MDCPLFPLFVWPPLETFVVIGVAAADCIVVRVVVIDRTDGAGEEKVLSCPLAELTPPPTVPVVASPDDAACDGATSECATSVPIVPAIDLFPIVGGGRPSSDDLSESLLRPRDAELIVFSVGSVENDGFPFVCVAESPTIPDSGYGLLLFEVPFFFDCDFI